jgi:hypothetical protein
MWDLPLEHKAPRTCEVRLGISECSHIIVVVVLVQIVFWYRLPPLAFMSVAPQRYRRPRHRVKSPPAPAHAPRPANAVFEHVRTETLCHGKRKVKGKARGECWQGVTEESYVNLLNILSQKSRRSVHLVQGLLGIISVIAVVIVHIRPDHVLELLVVVLEVRDKGKVRPMNLSLRF